MGGLSALVQQQLGMDPFSDALYLFTNWRRTKIKVLYWHRNGFCLWYKRLERERFAWPSFDGSNATQAITLRELEWLLEGFDIGSYKPHQTLHYEAVV
jgi:transposase